MARRTLGVGAAAVLSFSTAGSAALASDDEPALSAWAVRPSDAVAQASGSDAEEASQRVGRELQQSAQRTAEISQAIAQSARAAAPQQGSAVRGAAGGAGGTNAMQDVLLILKREGLIDDGEEQKVLAKYAVEARNEQPALLKGVEFTGDLQLRYETFRFDEDAVGMEPTNRTRFQYRARFGLTKQLNDWVKVGFRLSSGAGNARSSQVSFGETDNDGFAPDAIFFDRAFVDFTLQEGMSSKTQLVVGRLENPFLSRIGAPDFLLFDSDISLEGAYLTSSFRPNEAARIYATVGGFIVDEVQDAKDPKLAAGQLGFDAGLSPAFRFGLRGSAYQFRSLSDGFKMTGMFFGNLPSAFEDRAAIGEGYAYASLALSETWPIFAFGQLVKNFSAEPSVVGPFELEDEDRAYGYGVSIGNPSKLLQLSVAYYRGEANSFPAQFPDSATFDLFLNRKGFLVVAARRLNALTDVRLSYSDIREIRDTGGLMGPFRASFANSDRKRVVADLMFSF